MNQLHIQQPLWIGDRSNPAVGIARFRVLDKQGNPKKGRFRVWIDYKEKADNPAGWKLIYPFPFDILCSNIPKYKEMVLNDFKHTVLYIVPLADFYENKKYRSGSPRGRTMSQDDFNSLMMASNAVKQREVY